MGFNSGFKGLIYGKGTVREDEESEVRQKYVRKKESEKERNRTKL